MQIKITLSGVVTSQEKEVPLLKPGLWLITTKIDVSATQGTEVSGAFARIGDLQNIDALSLVTSDSEATSNTRFTFSQLLNITDAPPKVSLQGPGEASGSSATATFYICAEEA